MLTGTNLVFDIETVPDVESGRRFYDLENLNDDDVARAMRTLRIQKTSLMGPTFAAFFGHWSLQSTNFHS